MTKDFKHRKDGKKKPLMSLKEKRTKKHEKMKQKQEHLIQTAENMDHL